MDPNWQLYKKIGELIRKYRREKKFTQDRLADSVGLTRTSITNIESGMQKIQIHNLYSIAQVFNVPANKLLPEIELNTHGSSKLLPEGLRPKEQEFYLEFLKSKGE